MKKIKELFQGLFKRKVTIDLAFPTSWETMTFEEFKEVCIILLQPRTREETLFLCLCKLAHITPDDPRKYKAEKMKNKMAFIIDGKSYIITAPVIASACKQLAFIMDDIGLPPSPFKNVDRMLYDVSFNAYYKADSFLLRASVEKNEGFLKEAAKVLTNGQKRKLLPWERKAIVIWWNGVKKFLLRKYPALFSEGAENISERTQADILQDLLSVVNNNQPQQNDAILKCEVHSVLHALNKVYENAKQRSSQSHS